MRNASSTHAEGVCLLDGVEVKDFPTPALPVTADSGLIQVVERGPDRYTHIRMTTAGRQPARSWTNARDSLE